MTNRLIPILIWISAISCSGSAFLNGNGKTGNKDQSIILGSRPETTTIPSIPPKELPPVGTPHTSGPKPEAYAMPPGTVVFPVAVGGASLTCNPDPQAGMLCGLGMEAGKSFSPSYALYASEMEKAWIKTTVAEKNPGLFAVALPPDLVMSPLNVAIMLVDANNKYVADMEFPVSHTMTNLVKDPSFESHIINVNDVAASRSIHPGDQIAWIGKRVGTASSIPCTAYIELDGFATRPDLAAADGFQWLELTSRCHDDFASEKQNLTIYQQLDLEIGHTYRLTFAYRSLPNEFAPHKLNVMFGSDLHHSFTPATSEWTYLSFLVTATTPTAYLEFQEMGQLAGRGTNIDNIMVVDITNVAAEHEEKMR